MRDCSRYLLVLDDVWHKEHLEKLAFNINGMFTLVTTRQADKLKTAQIQPEIYKLDVLNARRLFCYWTFGQGDIPSWADKTLVQEIIAECKGLPLALKVIGRSLWSVAREPIMWRCTRDKLLQVDHYHVGSGDQTELFGRLGTSVDVLDLELRDCFVDLGAFPEDTENPVDNVLDIWVHVRGMEWGHAYSALNHLDYPLDAAYEFPHYMPEYGCGGSWVFSQHDVMRDLAIHLGRENLPVDRRNWLIMPQRQRSIPEDWRSPTSLAARVVSINTGRMTSQDWPALKFPEAVALLLYSDGDAYELPLFVRNMHMAKLKVLVVIYSGDWKSLRVCLQGLCCLESLYIRARKEVQVSDAEWDDIDGSMLKLKKRIVRTYDRVGLNGSTMPKLKMMIVRTYDRVGLNDKMVARLISSLEILTLEGDISWKQILRKQFRNLKACRMHHTADRSLLQALPDDMGDAFKMLRYISLYARAD